MNFETFKTMIKLIQNQDKKTNDLYKLGMDITEITNDFHSIYEIMLCSFFTPSGYDIIVWWLYDSSEKIITVDDVKYDVLSIEDFYKFIEKFYMKKECQCSKEV